MKSWKFLQKNIQWQAIQNHNITLDCSVRHPISTRKSTLFDRIILPALWVAKTAQPLIHWSDKIYKSDIWRKFESIYVDASI